MVDEPPPKSIPMSSRGGSQERTRRSHSEDRLYRIGALSPYCMVGWAVTIPVFWYITLHNIRAGHLPVPAPLRRAVNAVAGYHGAVLTGWFPVIAALILEQFWTYWSGLVT